MQSLASAGYQSERGTVLSLSLSIILILSAPCSYREYLIVLYILIVLQRDSLLDLLTSCAVKLTVVFITPVVWSPTDAVVSNYTPIVPQRKMEADTELSMNCIVPYPKEQSLFPLCPSCRKPQRSTCAFREHARTTVPCNLVPSSSTSASVYAAKIRPPSCRRLLRAIQTSLASTTTRSTTFDLFHWGCPL